MIMLQNGHRDFESYEASNTRFSKCVYPAKISTSYKLGFNVADQPWNNDDENETKSKSDIGFSTLHNVDTTSVSVSDVEATFIQRYLNVVST